MALASQSGGDVEGADGFRLEDQVGFALRRANQRHLSIFAARIAGLTPTQFAALAKLREIGAASQTALGRATAMDAATIKGVIDRLSARGLAAATPDRADRRCLVVALTPEGRRMFERLVDAAREVTNEALSPLTPAERRTLLSLLDKMA